MRKLSKWHAYILRIQSYFLNNTHNAYIPHKKKFDYIKKFKSITLSPPPNISNWREGISKEYKVKRRLNKGNPYWKSKQPVRAGKLVHFLIVNRYWLMWPSSEKQWFVHSRDCGHLWNWLLPNTALTYSYTTELCIWYNKFMNFEKAHV